jgi:hypothetical protein
MIYNTEDDLIQKRKEELKHASEIRELYEKKLEKANNLYMELNAVLLQLDEREKELNKREKILNINSKKIVRPILRQEFKNFNENLTINWDPSTIKYNNSILDDNNTVSFITTTSTTTNNNYNNSNDDDNKNNNNSDFLKLNYDIFYKNCYLFKSRNKNFNYLKNRVHILEYKKELNFKKLLLSIKFKVKIEKLGMFFSYKSNQKKSIRVNLQNGNSIKKKILRIFYNKIKKISRPQIKILKERIKLFNKN